MALFECDKCGSTKEYNDVLTTRVRNGEVVHFDTDDQPVDACQCGAKMRSVKSKEGWGHGQMKSVVVGYKLSKGQVAQRSLFVGIIGFGCSRSDRLGEAHETMGDVQLRPFHDGWRR